MDVTSSESQQPFVHVHEVGGDIVVPVNVFGAYVALELREVR